MTAPQADYRERIVHDPRILVGKPTVRGTRIPVELVLAKLAHNPDLNELFADYPRLTLEDVKACLEYARTLVEKQDRAARRRAIAAQTPRQRAL
jgi:uncharacterized protein (DUF433 family)